MDAGDAPLMISVSGVRGIVGRSLTPGVAVGFGQAFGFFLRSHKSGVRSQRPVVVIGRDTRPSGMMVFGGVSAGLMSVGVDVVDVDVATTPSVALMGRFLKADAAIVITASHNPIMWNGIKFLRDDGIAYPPAEAGEIKRVYLERAWEKEAHGGLVDIEGLGRFSTDSRVHAHHVQTVLALFDVKGIAQRRFKVVLDSVNGAGCVGTPMLLGKLGVELVHINGEATGRFAHTPEPVRENLGELCARVKEKRADVGFAQDPDADRLAIVDERGEYIGEEYTLALCTYGRMLSKPGTVCANLSTSRMVDDIAAKFGQTVVRTPVGEANVAGKMMEVGAVIGGEGNGGVIDLRVGPVRDSFLGMAMMLDVMLRTGKKVSELVGELPRYAMIKTKFECTAEQSGKLVERVKEKFADERIDTQDGVRVDWEDGWVHVRQSNTEPIARVIAEAAEEGRARELIAAVETLK
ncbi:MAG TPA: phosphoglucosamine mutase [Phycisphaerae bacterium]|nr:phosphoglucosamine mutase [Phycisphaerae bacterium]